MMKKAPILSMNSFAMSSQESSGVERRTSMGFDPTESNTGRAIWLRMKDAAIHASTPCSSQTSTACATLSKGVSFVAKITRPTDSRLRSS